MKNIKGIFLLLLFFCFLTGCGKFFNEGNSSEFNINQEITGMSSEGDKKNGKITIASFNAMRLGEKEKNYQITQ